MEGTVWQGMVAIPDTSSSSVITVQLVTASVELADDYRNVLLGTARTVTFIDPSTPVEARLDNNPAIPDSAAETVRSVFG